jgi:hypothetical protein
MTRFKQSLPGVAVSLLSALFATTVLYIAQPLPSVYVQLGPFTAMVCFLTGIILIGLAWQDFFNRGKYTALWLGFSAVFLALAKLIFG